MSKFYFNVCNFTVLEVFSELIGGAFTPELRRHFLALMSTTPTPRSIEELLVKCDNSSNEALAHPLKETTDALRKFLANEELLTIFAQGAVVGGCVRPVNPYQDSVRTRVWEAGRIYGHEIAMMEEAEYSYERDSVAEEYAIEDEQEPEYEDPFDIDLIPKKDI